MSDEELTSGKIYDNRFNRFDDELIDRYFNDDGKKAIKAYVDKALTAYRKELLSKAEIIYDGDFKVNRKMIPLSAIQKDEVKDA